MKRFSKMALGVLLCTAMITTAGCTKKKEKTLTLGEYKTISLKTSDIEEKAKTEIDTMLDQYGESEKIKKGKVKDGDTANIYYVGRVGGKKFEGGSCTKKTYPDGYDLTIGSNSFIEGFEEGLIGASVGDTLKVKATFPDPYQNNTELSGKTAVFTVTVNHLQGETKLPELNDAFVKANLSDYESVEHYKSSLRKDIVENLAWDVVFKDSKVENYPQDQVDKMYNQLNQSINYYLQQNNYSLTDYLSAQGTTSEDFKTDLTKTAKEDVEKQLIYGEIATNEKLEVSDKEYQESLREYLLNYQCEDEDVLSEMFQNYYGTDAKTIIEDDLLFKKVKEYLAENVKES